MCKNEFSTSDGFRRNEFAEKYLTNGLHLSFEQKTVKHAIHKIKAKIEKLIEDFKLNHSNFETEIWDHLSEIRRKIDIHREELKFNLHTDKSKSEIDIIALEMINTTVEREKKIIIDFKKSYEQIVNNDLQTIVHKLLDEFNNPALNIDNIKASAESQEMIFVEIKRQTEEFKAKLEQVKEFYFKPNACEIDKTFGFLNLCDLSRKMVSCSHDGMIRIYNLDTFECIKTFLGHRSVIWGLGKLSNDQFLSCSMDHSIKLWDVDTGLCIKTFYDDFEVYCLKALSKQTFASAGYEGPIKIWRVDEEKCLKTLIGHTDWVCDFLLLPNSSLVSCSADRTIRIWNVEKGITIKRLDGHLSSIYSLMLLKNGYLVSGSLDSTIKVWNLETGNCISTLVGHTGAVVSFVLKQNGEFISGSYDGTNNLIHLFFYFICGTLGSGVGLRVRLTICLKIQV